MSLYFKRLNIKRLDIIHLCDNNHYVKYSDLGGQFSFLVLAVFSPKGNTMALFYISFILNLWGFLNQDPIELA